MRVAPAEAVAQGRRIIAAIFRDHGLRIALLFFGLLVPLWVFVELADEIHELETFYFDEPLLWGANGMAAPLLDRTAVAVSAIGYQYGVVPLDSLIVLALLYARRWREAVFAGVSFAGSALLNLATKQFFQRDRPSLWESIAPETTFSFPSGHAMGSMSLAMVAILLAAPTRWRWPALLLAGLFVLAVGASRVYLGVHYPSDILGGWAAGMAWVAGVYLLLYGVHRRPWHPLPRRSGGDRLR
ncbi:phosphatase PAP2 family protein [Pseudoxanthomonas wuyuanensis]|uniref:undecaprenyl-diphosphate phosphatase n=1 Tax=Pseudoxanthomonas wuyuanensis TaxID=1073196 RepID=A0A286CVP2_9GAMM|nr:phosphatase PAP2 family protein [Pseudoxanthomonas wuyuanensis]KAF1721292.1 PAP2 family protein [Pseudoxanthomonas wuyuanensis]SOD50463.1 undecaprenyl-diphosphatase [Pseudoxanthomonas wuyuanensis]